MKELVYTCDTCYEIMDTNTGVEIVIKKLSAEGDLTMHLCDSCCSTALKRIDEIKKEVKN